MAKLNEATNTQSEKHTPLPWECNKTEFVNDPWKGFYIQTPREYFYNELTGKEDNRAGIIATVCGDDKEAQANATFIVEAVNQHYGLKARVKELEGALESFIHAWLDYSLKLESEGSELDDDLEDACNEAMELFPNNDFVCDEQALSGDK
jgi:hypothetical protein